MAGTGGFLRKWISRPIGTSPAVQVERRKDNQCWHASTDCSWVWILWLLLPTRSRSNLFEARQRPKSFTTRRYHRSPPARSNAHSLISLERCLAAYQQPVCSTVGLFSHLQFVAIF